jgi:hypothetical protein
MKIFLDDDPRRDNWVDETWTITRTAEECLGLLYLNPGVEELSLDHDLGTEFTGYTVVKTLETMAGIGVLPMECLPKKITIHSANPVGRKNIQAAIDSIERIRSVR